MIKGRATCVSRTAVVVVVVNRDSRAWTLSAPCYRTMLNVSVQFQTYHPDPDSEELAWDIHFWIGKYSSQVNKVFSLFRTKVTSIPFCLQTYNPKPGSNLLAWDVHFWIGKYSSQVSELENPIHCWFSPKQLNLDVVDCLLTVWGEH